MELPDLVELVKATGETRNLELKRSVSWEEEETKFKMTKSIMAMSNIRDGGTIILGVEEKPNHKFDPVGMNASDIDSFSFDNMQDHVNRYAHPYARISVSHIPDIQSTTDKASFYHGDVPYVYSCPNHERKTNS
jgi:predicted HTH transcriptional regulator